MRCLGRVVALLVLVVVLGLGWLYRSEVVRYARGVVDPMSVARRTGTPSASAYDSAEAKLKLLQQSKPDSVLLGPSELASLLALRKNLPGGNAIDSISVELGDRSIRLRALIDGNALPDRVKRMVPGGVHREEEVIVNGPMNPVRPGVAEWRLTSVIVRGLPLPGELVGKVIARVTGHDSDGRIVFKLPNGISGFRIRPEGVAIYRSGGT